MNFENIRLLLTLALILFLLIGFIFFSLSNYALLKKRPIKSLFLGFKAKMWMTFGIGLFFFSLYFFVIWLGSQYIDHEVGLSLFFKVYHSPTFFIYAGLLTCICFSFMIYLTRMIIKYVFLTRGKEK